MTVSTLKHNMSGDIWGGFAAMLVALPSAIAFGVTIFAPLGSEFGAKGALAGMLGVTALGLIAAIFGGTQRLISAPCAPAAAVLSAIAIEYTRQNMTPEMIVLCLFLIALSASLGQILFGVLKIGRLMRYMPYTVVSGYLSGVGIVVILSQIPKWLATPKGTNWWQSLISPDLWQLPSLLIGLVTGLAMIYGPKLTHKVPAVIIGLAGGIITYWLLAFNQRPILLNIENNPFVIGHLSADFNGMVDNIQGLWQSLFVNAIPRWDQILVPAITLAVLLSIDTLKTCLVLDALTGSRHNSNQELIGQGLGNLTSTLLGGAPGAGTMGATLVNKASGGETFLSGVFQGVWALLAVIFLTPLIAWIPTASLAALLLVIGYRMIDVHSFKLLKSNDTWLDFGVIVLVIIVANTVSLIAASGLGVLLAILLFISEQVNSSNIKQKSFGDQRFSKRVRTRQEIEILKKDSRTNVIIELQGSLFFGTTDQLFVALEEDLKTAKFLILDFKRVQSLDFTAGHMLERFEQTLRERGAKLVLSRLPEKTIAGKNIKTYINHVGLQNSEVTHLFDDLLDALEWVENETLNNSHLKMEYTDDLSLNHFELFKNLESNEIQILETIIQHQYFKKGEVIFKVGKSGQQLMMISNGLVRISIQTPENHTSHLTTLGKGQYFGEISFVDLENRSADAIAIEDTHLICIYRSEFDSLLKYQMPIIQKVFANISLSLAHRLRNTTDEMRHLMDG